jgi:hypothetical protein
VLRIKRRPFTDKNVTVHVIESAGSDKIAVTATITHYGTVILTLEQFKSLTEGDASGLLLDAACDAAELLQQRSSSWAKERLEIGPTTASL